VPYFSSVGLWESKNTFSILSLSGAPRALLQPTNLHNDRPGKGVNTTKQGFIVLLNVWTLESKEDINNVD